MRPSYGTGIYHAPAMAEPLNASMRFVILHGKDSFLIVERIRRFQAALTAKFGEVSRFDFDGGGAQAVDVIDELRTFGLLATHKFVIVDKADQFLAKEETRRTLERYAESPMEEATLLLRSESWRPGNLDKLVAKIGAVLKCDPPDVGDAKAWCMARAGKAYGFEVDADAADALVERVGNDLARLDSELAKYGSYLASEPDGSKRLTKPIVALLTGQTREEAAWEVQESLLAGKPAAAVRKVRELIEVSQAPEQLVLWSMVDLARKLHDAARMLSEGVPEGAVAKQIRLWGPATTPTLRAARTIGPKGAAVLFREAVDLDRRSKSGLAGELPRTLEAFASSMSGRLATGHLPR
jgi:DNA polymerase III delta subunit